MPPTVTTNQAKVTSCNGDIERRIAEIKFISWLVDGWSLKHEDGISLRFEKEVDGTVLVVYPRKMSVITKLFHPRYKRHTTMVRTDVNLKQLKKIFEYPRQHTGKGMILKSQYDTQNRTRTFQKRKNIQKSRRGKSDTRHGKSDARRFE